MSAPHPAAVVGRRLEMLRALAAAPRSKPALRDELDVSRSTVDRGVRELGALQFVASTPDGYRLTLPGRLALRAHDDSRERVADVAEVADLLWFADVDATFDPAVLERMTAVRAPPHDPSRPADCAERLLADATHTTVYISRVLTRNGRIFHDRIRDGMTGTFIATDSVFDAVLDGRRGNFQEAVALGRAAYRRVDRDDATTLILVESPNGPEMGLVVYDDSTPRGFLGSDAPAAVRWTRNVLEDVLAAAEPMPM